MSDTPTPARAGEETPPDDTAFGAVGEGAASVPPARRATAVYSRTDGAAAAQLAVAEEAKRALLRPQAPILADLISKNSDKLADQAATTIKVLFGTAYAGVSQDEMEERLDYLLGALATIARSGATQPDQIAEFAGSILVGPQFEGYDAATMTVEVLRVVDMVVTKLVDQKLPGDANAATRSDSKALLARVISEARLIVSPEDD